MIPLNPFPGVMAVAPSTDSLLSTIPPRAMHMPKEVLAWGP